MGVENGTKMVNGRNGKSSRRLLEVSLHRQLGFCRSRGLKGENLRIYEPPSFEEGLCGHDSTNLHNEGTPVCSHSKYLP